MIYSFAICILQKLVQFISSNLANPNRDFTGYKNTDQFRVMLNENNSSTEKQYEKQTTSECLCLKNMRPKTSHQIRVLRIESKIYIRVKNGVETYYLKQQQEQFT